MPDNRHIKSIVLASLIFCSHVAVSATMSPQHFQTHAKFSVDNDALALSSAVATIEARRGAPGYSWVRIYFYAFLPAPEDLAEIANGKTGSMDRKWQKLADRHDQSYNHSRAVIQLSVDKNFRVWQVDMSIPGHSCTIAPFEQDVKKFLREYRFDGKTLTLKSKGSYQCDMSSMKIPNQMFGWEIDLQQHVFPRQ